MVQIEVSAIFPLCKEFIDISGSPIVIYTEAVAASTVGSGDTLKSDEHGFNTVLPL